jgi:hypothetical protein
MPRVNLTDVESGGFDPIPAGSYQAKVTDGEIRESGPNAKNPGAEYINWEFTIQGGEFDGRKQWQNTSLLPQALFSVKGLLEATGRFTADQLNGDLDFEIEDVLGADVTIVVRQREWDNETRNEVKRVKAAGETASDSSLLPG